jgi:O-antigen/teichoic acid export membrane protein
MGENFKDSYLVVVLLIAPGFVSLTQEIAYTYLFVINELKYRAFLFLSAALGSLILSFLLAPTFGAVGCAIGIFSATFGCHVLGMNYIYWKKVKLDIPRFFKECFGSLLLPLVMTFLFGFFLSYSFTSSNFLIFMIKALILSLFYILSVWLLGLKIEEKDLFMTPVQKLINKFNRN